jgi:hypothetical protein
MGGGLDSALPLPAPLDAAISTLGAFCGIIAVAGLDAALKGTDEPEEASPLPLLIYSFGASAVLLYGVPESKLAQPRNVIGGQVVCALVGAAVRLALGAKALWVTSAAGMALSLTAMEALSLVHPPGGATALIAASARNPGPWHGFRLTASSPLRHAGTRVGDYSDYRGCAFRTPPSIGAFEVCSGDAATARTATPVSCTAPRASSIAWLRATRSISTSAKAAVSA